MDDESLHVLHALEVKTRALEYVVLWLLQLQGDDTKNKLRILADSILIQFSSERPGIDKSLADYHQELASALAEIIRLGDVGEWTLRGSSWTH